VLDRENCLVSQQELLVGASSGADQIPVHRVIRMNGKSDCCPAIRLIQRSIRNQQGSYRNRGGAALSWQELLEHPWPAESVARRKLAIACKFAGDRFWRKEPLENARSAWQL